MSAGIDRIIAQQAGGAGGMPHNVREAQQQAQQQRQQQSQNSQSSQSSGSERGTLTIRLPDPATEREEWIFWMNVVQTLLLVWMFLRR